MHLIDVILKGFRNEQPFMKAKQLKEHKKQNALKWY